MRLICTLTADLSALARGLQTERNGFFGKKYYRVDYNVCVYFGGTQLYAKLEWKEKVSTSASHSPSLLTKIQGSTREGPVAVIPTIQTLLVTTQDHLASLEGVASCAEFDAIVGAHKSLQIIGTWHGAT